MCVCVCVCVVVCVCLRERERDSREKRERGLDTLTHTHTKKESIYIMSSEFGNSTFGATIDASALVSLNACYAVWSHEIN